MSLRDLFLVIYIDKNQYSRNLDIDFGLKENWYMEASMYGYIICIKENCEVGFVWQSPKADGEKEKVSLWARISRLLDNHGACGAHERSTIFIYSAANYSDLRQTLAFIPRPPTQWPIAPSSQLPDCVAKAAA
jgi:hypothetical protein